MTTLILGLGRFGGGREATRFLARRGIPLRVCDRASAESLGEAVAALQELPIDWQLGTESPTVLDGIDRLVVNPAIPDHNPILTEARTRAIPITQEVNLFLEAYPGRVVLVTGTDGKSSTSRLLASALSGADIPHLLGGNIGHSLLADEANWSPDQVAVLEASSFQLERIPHDQGVTGCVLTPIGSDHLDRHGTLDAYRGAKAKAPAAAREFVIQGDDPVARAMPSPARRIEVGPEHPTGVHDGWITVAGHRLLHRQALRLRGGFQAENATLAAAAAMELGAVPHGAAVGLATCAPLPHRLQIAATIEGVEYWDNGVSTALASTLSAVHELRALGRRVHWVGGGAPKGDPIAATAQALGPLVATAHGFGAAGAELVAAMPAIPTSTSVHLQDALTSARAAATGGEAVLFSPAFASFDQFANFRQRAQAMLEWLATTSRAIAGSAETTSDSSPR